MKALKAFICHNYLYVYLLELYNYTGKKLFNIFVIFLHIFVNFLIILLLSLWWIIVSGVVIFMSSMKN